MFQPTLEKRKQAVMLLYGLLQLLCKVIYFTHRQLREMLVEYWTDLCFDNQIDLELIIKEWYLASNSCLVGNNAIKKDKIRHFISTRADETD